MPKAKAQMPEIKTDGQSSGKVYLQKLAVDVRIAGAVATTTWTMTFKNTTSKILEGELTFPLADGITVSRYALDINGKMREAVPVEKAKATQVFEAIERRQVDPGLLEKIDGNSFRTRIYPINPNSTRTVTIAYDETLRLTGNTSLVYRLPFAFERPIELFDINISVLQNTVKPVFEENLDNELSFKEWENNYTASQTFKNYVADKPVAIQIPKQYDKTEVLMQHVGNHYVFLANAFVKDISREKVLPSTITVLWDASLSGIYRDTKKEIRLLEEYLKKVNNVKVTLVTFSNTILTSKEYVIANGVTSELKAALQNVVYDGGTQLGVLDLKKWPANEYLLFSDGHSTYNKADISFANAPVYAINSSAKADYPSLHFITQKSGGTFINLINTEIAAAKKLLLYQSLQFLGVKANNNIEETFPALPTPVSGSVAVTGFSYEPKQEIVLLFGYGNKVISEQRVSLNFDKQQTDKVDLSKIWAQQKIGELDIQYDANKSTIEQLGKRYGIITRNTSLMVLENVADYVQYEIEPPVELRDEYDRLIKQRSEQRQNRVNTSLNNAEHFFNELLKWWNMDIQYQLRKKVQADSIASLQRNVASNASRSRTTTPAPHPNLRRTDAAATMYAAPAASDSRLEEVVITGSSKANKTQSTRFTPPAIAADAEMKGEDEDETPTGSFTIKAQAGDSNYLNAIRKEVPAKQYEKYLSIRDKYKDVPVFYFTVANYFFGKGEKEIALRILSNIAELDAENYELYKLLGYKLKEIKEFEPAAFAFRKVLDWRPMDPQSYRDYALALEDAGKYQQALDTLYVAITNNYAENISNMYYGIEETILPEINRLIALYGDRLNITRIPKKIIQAMPVDIRVVLNWNMNDTDIDLWVTDPNDEKCYYSHKSTVMGGRISTDFTRGFGPEQFLLRKAMKGKYKVEINYYGDRQLKIAGPTTVMAEVFTRYGTANEKRQIITLQMKKDAKGGVLIGEFDF